MRLQLKKFSDESSDEFFNCLSALINEEAKESDAHINSQISDLLGFKFLFIVSSLFESGALWWRPQSFAHNQTKRIPLGVGITNSRTHCSPLNSSASQHHNDWRALCCFLGIGQQFTLLCLKERSATRQGGERLSIHCEMKGREEAGVHTRMKEAVNWVLGYKLMILALKWLWPETTGLRTAWTLYWISGQPR